MKWNWQQADWPDFHYKQAELQKFERDFCKMPACFWAHINTVAVPTKKHSL